MDTDQVDPRLYAALMQQKNQDNLIKYQLDAESELERLRLNLLGLKIDERGEIVKDPIKTRKINEQGADAVISFLEPYITKIISLSDVDKEEINTICEEYATEVFFLLNRHAHEYEIPSYQMLTNISILLDNLVYMTFKKAMSGKERDTLRKQFTHVESQERITETRPNRPGSPFINPFQGGRK